MYRSHLRHVAGLFVILLAILACALPGQTIQPAPVTDPNAISTAVAGTAQAAEQQTQQANPVPATATIAPTDTSTPTPRVSSAGASLLTLADGSTQFTDHLASIQMLFPAMWLVFRVGEPEYYAAWERHNLGSIEAFASMQNIDPNVLRVVALEMRSGQVPDTFVTAVIVIFLAGNMSPLEEWEQTKRDNPSPCAGFKLISSSYPQTNNGTRYLLLEQSCDATEGDTLYFRHVYFSLPSGMLHISFESNFGEMDVTIPEFDQVINSVTILNP